MLSMCEISTLGKKIEDIWNSANTALNDLKHNDNSSTDALKERATFFLQQELQSINEHVRWLRDTRIRARNHFKTRSNREVNQKTKNVPQNKPNCQDHVGTENIDHLHMTSQQNQRSLLEDKLNLEHKQQITNHQSQKRRHHNIHDIKTKKFHIKT